MRFDNIEPNFIYQPICYDAANGKCIPVGYPFVFIQEIESAEF